MSMKRSGGFVPGVGSQADASAVSTIDGVDQTLAGDGDVLAMANGAFTQVTSPAPTMTASSTTSGAASDTIDNDTGTFWRSDFMSYAEQWIQADFGVPVTLSRISMQQRNDVTYSRGVKVAVSDDGTTFTDIKSYAVTPEYAGSRLDFGVITARYWRVIDTTSQVLKWEIHELDFYSQVQTWTSTVPDPAPVPTLLNAGTNGDVLALNVGSYSVVSSPTPNAEATHDEDGSPNIVDGSTSTRWQSQYMSYYTQWIRLDYGEQVMLSRFVLDQHTSGNTTPSVKVSASNDGQTWTMLANVSGLGVSTTEYIDFPTTTARYFRVEDTNGAVVQWYVYRLDGWVRTETYSPRDTWLDALFRRPSDETVHDDDQEFNGTIGGTALTVSGTATWTQGKGRLSGLFDTQAASDAAARLYSLTPISSPVTIETALTVWGVSQSTNIAGLVFSDGVVAASNSVVMLFGRTTTATYLYKMAGTLADLASGLNANAIMADTVVAGVIYLRLIWSASNTFKVQASPDGITWSAFGQTSASKTMTPTHIGVLGTTWSGTNNLIASFEYLRVTESDLSA